MKQLYFTLILSLIFSCKKAENKSENSESTPETNSTEVKNDRPEILIKIANAHGFENWLEINELKYSFNVDRGGDVFTRSWTWQPKAEKVSMTTADTTLTYNLNKVDSTLQRTDQAFINDKYWLLFPFQLAWDDNFDTEIKSKIEAPISEKKLTEVSINYKNEAGYTPGDTYKIYVDENHIIREWSYIPNGKQEPAMSTSWEDYETFKGLKIAKTHQNKDKTFKLYFTDISAN